MTSRQSGQRDAWVVDDVAGTASGDPMLARCLSEPDPPLNCALHKGVLRGGVHAPFSAAVFAKHGQRAGTAVVHIDGRWGTGKSTLVNLLVERLGSRSSLSARRPSSARVR